MEFLLTGKQMRNADLFTQESIGIAAPVLMERAALALRDEAERASGCRQFVLFCGRGGNGADGIAAARLLMADGKNVLAVLVGGMPYSDSLCGRQLSVYRALNGRSSAYGSPEYAGWLENAAPETICVIDALCGIGFRDEMKAEFKAAAKDINHLRSAGSFVISADLPSGICADDGSVSESAVLADVTLAFGAKKLGEVLYPGAGHCGTLRCCDIGIPEKAVMASLGCDDSSERSLKQERSTTRMTGAEGENTPDPAFFTLSRVDLGTLPERPPDGSKGTFGRILLLAGNRGMAGAAMMSAEGALKSGAGMVRVITPEENHTALAARLPEAMISAWHPETVLERPPDFSQEAGWADVYAAGPGIGSNASSSAVLSRFLETIFRRKHGALVLDADALRILAADSRIQALLAGRPENFSLVLTPHPGEFYALTECPVSSSFRERLDAGRKLAAKYRACVVLKDARTAVLTPHGVFLNTLGNSGMATAGSGDVLTGITAAMLFRYHCGTSGEADAAEAVSQAACMAVLLHAAAGDLASEELGPEGMTATDITARLGRVLRTASEEPPHRS